MTNWNFPPEMQGSFGIQKSSSVINHITRVKQEKNLRLSQAMQNKDLAKFNTLSQYKFPLNKEQK